MKLFLTTALALLAAPAFAQTMPTDPATPGKPQTMTPADPTAPAPTQTQTPTQAPQTDPAPPPQTDSAAPGGGDVPNTQLSTEPTPSTGPRAQEATMPGNSAVPANMSNMATAPQTTAPEQPLAHYPICKKGQFDNCMEPGNGGHKAGKRRPR